MIAGDFNLHHKLWQPSHQHASSGAERFVTWLEEHFYTLISEPDVATHERGNVLDLAFVSPTLLQGGTTTEIPEDMDVTSDHLPLLTRIPWNDRFREPLCRLKPGTIDDKVFTEMLSKSLEAIQTLQDPSPLEIDSFTEKLVDSIHNAYEASAKRTLSHNRKQPWWNADCSMARRSHREVLRWTHGSQDTGRAFRRTVKQAKTSFFKKVLEKAKTSREIFSMVKWHKTQGSYRSPPLLDPSRPDLPPAVSLADKRQVLARNLLCNAAQAVDIPIHSPTVSRHELPFPEITSHEIENAVLRAGSTTPGKDEISTPVLRIAWPMIGPLVTNLYKNCLKIGYHPSSFRNAVVAIIAKPNKADLTTPRSYRPIALLSVLGKGLERLVAKRMSWIAIKYKVLARQQFGALALRSSVDLTTCLTNDVETALKQGLVASVLTLDIKGAFDATLPGRLVRRLREQGWPAPLVSWVSSFATNRSVHIRMDGEVGPLLNIDCGLPQGSPISPILFMLYISPLFKMGTPHRRFGYADDVALLQISDSAETNAIKLSESLAEALDWGATEGITFEPTKSELIHFTRKRNPTSPRVEAGTHIVEENHDRPYVRWLGVLFDRKLTFKHHAHAQFSKATKTANALRCWETPYEV